MQKLMALRKRTSIKISITFLFPGILSLIFSIFYESQASAFVGLGLTFWGALFFLLKPTKYVAGKLLYSSVQSSYSTFDRIIKGFGYKTVAYCIPSYPKDVYLPDHLKGLKEIVTFIPAQQEVNMPSIEELADSKFQLDNSKGILLTSPGASLLSQFEKELNIDFGKTKLTELCEILPDIISQNLNLAQTAELKVTEDQIQLRLFDSLYKDLYSRENNLKSINILGCPLVNAIACALAKSSAKPIVIQNLKASTDNSMIEVLYRIVQL